MYLGYQNEKIKFYVEEPLDPVMYPVDRWEETEDEYVADGDQFIKKDAEYIAKELEIVRHETYEEANIRAERYLDGEALYEFEEGKHIEATDGNIAKFTAYALAYVTGQYQPEYTVIWNTKEDETVELNQEQVVAILNGLGQVQAVVWAVKYPYYVALIEAAETVQELLDIDIDYSKEINDEHISEN